MRNLDTSEEFTHVNVSFVPFEILYVGLSSAEVTAAILSFVFVRGMHLSVLLPRFNNTI